MRSMINFFREWFLSCVTFVAEAIVGSPEERQTIEGRSREDCMVEDRMMAEGGFTLMELLIVLALIATISMIAIPVYSNYLQRAKITEGLTLAKGIQLEAELYYALNGDWPQKDAHEQLGLGAAESYRGNSVESIALARNQIIITYNDEVKSEGSDSAKLRLTAQTTGGTIQWACQGENIVKEHLPKECLPQ
ncbi:prepilin-type N-terminal cleavage/methylation domain-containing protein [Ignatzschineria indica]|uniref:Prepilin-type cleavage/methylation domain-containing protein n=1 Tax=Ignatzschineria indica TaxID=472583 RepID=A0A2U2AJW7_9GAMM|nr:pilin [Ignatzschineria indica]PWD83128.1 prepilin-type cleavage/methylation domain-containing protein [Ignatzschineria indica]GGZ82677.1 prepilin-type N-terminal cleavage/methylation domain-containing protein [Ignatzschineria indica]